MSKAKKPPSNSRLSMPKPYIALPHFLLERSPDFGNKLPYDVMSKTAFRTLGFLMRQYRGWNNGDLTIAPKMCKEYGIPRSTARTGVAELEYLGLVIETRRGGLNLAALYGLAWLGFDDEVSSKFDDHISASSTPIRTWMLQYRHYRTPHLVKEHERNIDKRAAGRWKDDAE